jgi:hypothetical protein
MEKRNKTMIVQPKASLEEIDSERAKKYLEKNKNNRPLRLWQVKSYESKLKNGSFQDYAQTISFDVNGNLIDGQHRLQAIANSGMSAKFVVLYDLPEEVAEVIDQGSSRSVMDILKINNNIDFSKYKYPSEKIAITTKLFNGFGVDKENRASNSEQALFIEKNHLMLEEFIRIFDKAPNNFGKAAISTAFVNKFLSNPSKKQEILLYAKKFVGKEAGFTKKDALFKFQSWYIKTREAVKKHGGDMRTNQIYSYALQALEDQINGKNTKLVECSYDQYTNTKYHPKDEEV